MISATNYSSGGTIVQAVEFTYDVFDRWIAKTVDDDGAGLFLLGLFEGADSWTSGPFEK